VDSDYRRQQEANFLPFRKLNVELGAGNLTGHPGDYNIIIACIQEHQSRAAFGVNNTGERELEQNHLAWTIVLHASVHPVIDGVGLTIPGQELLCCQPNPGSLIAGVCRFIHQQDHSDGLVTGE